VPTAYYAKGNYFTLSGRSPFSRLIYPVPVPGGLGVHLTVDLGGQARFGPDVEWVEAIDYTVDPSRSDSFYAAVRSSRDVVLFPAPRRIRPRRKSPARTRRKVTETRGRADGRDGFECAGVTPGAIAAHVLAASRTANDRTPTR
jgi:hypothetical protein